MDKKTFAQFLIFSAIVLLAWWAASYFIYKPPPAAPAPPPPPVRRAAAPRAEAAPVAPTPTETAQRPEGAQPPAPAQATKQPAPVEAVLANDLIKTTWTNKGASLVRLELSSPHYRAPYKVNGKRPVLALLQDFERGLYSDTVQSVTFFSGSGEQAAETTVDTSGVVYDVIERSAERLVMEATFGDGRGHTMRLRKTVTLAPGKHNYDAALEFENVSVEPYEVAYTLRGPAGIERETLEAQYTGTRVAVRTGPQSYKIAKLAPKDLRKGPQANTSTNFAWAAVVNHYFAAVLVPEETQWVASAVSETVTDTDMLEGRGRWGPGTVRNEADRPTLAREDCAVLINTAKLPLEPGKPLNQKYVFLAVPKDDAILGGYDVGLDGLVEFGMLPTVSRLTVALLNVIYALFRNYGVAIIILTLLVRLVLHPLSRKSQLSMTKMQKLQPLIAELQKKYGDDKQKVTQEQMLLWRKYGVTPWGGCLPILLQMPVLFALYGALGAAIELRHASFLWVEDLSRPDTLFLFPFNIPFIGYEFNLLPILMAIVMFLNSYFTPEPASEQARQQQKIMKWMPVFFAFFFYRMPAGLSLYFMASTGIGMLERWVIDRQALKMEMKPVGETGAKAKRRPVVPGKASGKTWLDKLADLQNRVQRPGRAGRRDKGGNPKR
jgi:YidC/Oxa1 family membrane protein insertase